MHRPRRIGVAIAAGLVLVTGALAWRAISRDDAPARPPSGALADALDDARPAAEPFAGWTEARVVLEGDELRVVVADQPDERRQGLRGRDDVGGYDGMLFVFPSEDEGAFTMATVPVDLDIVWYDAEGRAVDRTRMAACPNGTDATCPTYMSSVPYRFALETIAPPTRDGPGVSVAPRG
jgi:uncharacterized membrane protein (UPF0127 family)